MEGLWNDLCLCRSVDDFYGMDDNTSLRPTPMIKRSLMLFKVVTFPSGE